jgi:hypothetical protein
VGWPSTIRSIGRRLSSRRPPFLSSQATFAAAERAELLHSLEKFLKKGLAKPSLVNVDSRALERCSTVSGPNSGEHSRVGQRDRMA